MKTKKAWSLLLCLALLFSMIAGTGAVTLSAQSETAKVPFRSPAILANVGDKIDLTKYGVEFAEGVNTTEGLTWWKEGVSGLTVPYANPALFANVGDTVNFTNYDVELTEGNTVKADQLTWSQTMKQNVIPANNLILQAEAGEKVDLKYWTVEGMGASLSWKLGDTVVPEITAKAGDLLTVSDGTTTKEVVVATKDGDTDNYVVYENNFDVDGEFQGMYRPAAGTASQDQFAFSVKDGAFVAKRSSTYKSSVENASVMLPAYLWNFNRYSISFVATNTNCMNKQYVNTDQTTTVSVGLIMNANNGDDIRPHHLFTVARGSNFVKTATRIVESKYAASISGTEKDTKNVKRVIELNIPAGYMFSVEGTEATAYYDYDAETQQPTGTFQKMHTYDFADDGVLTADHGAIGLHFFRGDWLVDDLKVTVPTIEYTTKDVAIPFVGYTPTEKGVVVFTVTDGTTSRDVYLVVKNVEDTEYVLYENNFDVDGDFGGMYRPVAGSASDTQFPFEVKDGVLSAVRDSSYGSSVENASVMLPAYVWNFNKYDISFVATNTDCVNKRDKNSQELTVSVGLIMNASTGDDIRPHHLFTVARGSNFVKTATRIVESKYATSISGTEKDTKNVKKVIELNAPAGYMFSVEGTEATAYYDYDVDLKAPVGTFKKMHTYDFAADGVVTADHGAIGLHFFRGDWLVDDLKVTISAETVEPSVELQEITSFTPAEAGVTPITVKCGDVEKTIYVVAKNAVDTEYVLYENNFEADEDANDLTVVQGEADMSVADGWLTIDGNTSIGSNSDKGAYIRLPEWLGEFGDYEISAKVVRDTYKSSSEALGFFARSANADDAESLYIVRSRFTNNVSDCLVYGERIPGTAKPRTYSWGLRKNARLYNATQNAELGVYNIIKMGVAGDTVNMQIIDQDEIYGDDDILLDDDYVLYATEQKNLRTGYIGLFITDVIVHYDYIRVTVPALPDAPTAATFTPDADLVDGTIAGKLDVTLPGTGIEPSDVIFYWGNGEGKLPGYAAFEKILVVNNATELSYTIPAGTAVPAGATELRVYAMNLAGESTDCIVIPLDGITAKEGEKLFSFIVNSDWHIAASMSATTGLPVYSTANNDAHFIQMIERMKAADPEATQIFFGGDIVDGQKGAANEYARLVNLIETYAQGYTFDGILGNHEYWFTAEEEAAGNNTYAYTINNFANYMNIPITAETPYYSKDFNGYQFFFLNTIERDGTSTQSHNDSTLGTAQLAWLDAGLAAATAQGKPAFVFHHQPIGNQIVDKDALVAVLKKYPTAIFVSSHSHDELQQQSTFALADDAMCNTVDTSAVTFVIPAHYNKGTENVRGMSEGYLVEMYADRVVFRGMDLMTGEWLPTATFSFAYEAGQKPNTAVAETNDEGETTITVKAEEGYQLKAGSLLVEDAEGNWFVPTRVGWREGGNAEQYEVVDNEGNPIGKAPFTVYAEFYQPGVDGAPLNMGLIGTSVHQAQSGLRFVHRLNMYEKGGKLYMLSNGTDQEITEYGLLLAAGTVVTDPADLTIETAEANGRVLQYKWPETNKYYDKCDDNVDIAVHIKNIEAYNGGDVPILTRTYVKLADGTVVYDDVNDATYNEAFRTYESATLAELEAGNNITYVGRSYTTEGVRSFRAINGASGFVLSGQLEGNLYADVSLTSSSDTPCVLNVEVDGKLANTIWIDKGETTVMLAKNLVSGKDHTVRVLRGSSNMGTLKLSGITYCGTLGTPVANELNIEVLGDSITAAGGGCYDLNPSGDYAKQKAYNTYYGYAAQTARALGADLDLIAASGKKVADIRTQFTDGLANATATQEIVVINLGTNDFGFPGKNAPDATCIANIKGLLDDIRDAYGNDVYIIWAYGMMFDQYIDELEAVVEEYALENGDAKVMFCDLSSAKNNDGAEQHPNQAGHDAAAELLTAFIRNNCADALQ